MTTQKQTQVKKFFFREWTNGTTQLSTLLELTEEEIWDEVKDTQSHVTCHTCNTIEEAIELRAKLIAEY